jgi:hypothetical protein
VAQDLAAGTLLEYDENLTPAARLLPDGVPISHGVGGAEMAEGEEDRSEQHQVCERKLNRKLDLALLPLLSVLYLFNGLDRANVGNAQTQGTWWPIA